MTQYSVGGIEITLEEAMPAGGYRCGTGRRFEVRNCEWSAEFLVHSGYRGPLEPMTEVWTHFCEGNHDKYCGDLPRIEPLIHALMGAPGSTVIVHQSA